jgi:DNA-binding MarR family transcriptional regulator
MSKASKATETMNETMKKVEATGRMFCRFFPNPERLKQLEQEYPDFKSYYFQALQALMQLTNGIEKMGEQYHARNHFSRARYLTLMVLYQEDSKKLIPNEIANRMGVTRGNMTGVIDQLIKDGYVKKYQDQEDRRQVWIEITDKGEGYLRKVFPDYFKRLSRVLNEVSREELQDFNRISRKLFDGINRFWDGD